LLILTFKGRLENVKKREYFVKFLLMKKDLIECFFVNVERRIKFLQGKILGTILCEGKDYLLFMTCLVLSCAFIGGEESLL